MAKAKPETTTAWIKRSRAKALASEYLGDSEFVERELLNGLQAGEIPWRCARFVTDEQYSGPGSGDPKFWEIDPDQLVASVSLLIVRSLRGIRIEGDSATRIDGAAAYGMELDRSALVRLKLLPPSGDRSSARKKRKAPQVGRILSALEDPKLFPGGVPDDTNVVLPKVVKYLEPETKRLGLSAPGWDSVDRALKQYRAKSDSSAESA